MKRTILALLLIISLLTGCGAATENMGQIVAVHALAAGHLVVTADDDGNVALLGNGDRLVHAVRTVVQRQRQVVVWSDVGQLDHHLVIHAVRKAYRRPGTVSRL